MSACAEVLVRCGWWGRGPTPPSRTARAAGAAKVQYRWIKAAISRRALRERPQPHVTATTSPAAEYVFQPAATVETALVCLEIYRRDGAWRLRAVGQGYADGLAGLARDFGVDVA